MRVLSLDGLNDGGCDAEKKRCIKCGSGKVKRNGTSRHGRQRWLCCECGRSFGWRNLANGWHRRRVWFRRWMTGGATLRQMAQQSGKSLSTMRRVVHYWLAHPPSSHRDIRSTRSVILDGTFVEGRRGLFVAMDAQSMEVIHGKFPCAEGPVDMQRFCRELADRGVRPVSATLDGNPHLRRALRRQWPDIRLQRCLVHVQRQGLSWCRRSPHRADARALRGLFLQTFSLTTVSQRDGFLRQCREWEERYGKRLPPPPLRGWVASDIVRARSMLQAALPDMFTYLDEPLAPKTTNAVEGYFGRLKHHYRHHHGLAKRQLPGFFSWYLRFQPR